ncbi:Signal transduction histidine kinase [Pseudomonas syringae pv. actinidiae]|uniref:Signal transduction histidine kinase n=1 Tax=Pseudomonas syringae pv. actinidiae TaxID=103796 RepID=A0A2V0Q5Q2_PSESF|nr:Signal transduction histidine kinase [Pseudomonas syringae pv. actinidiae]
MRDAGHVGLQANNTVFAKRKAELVAVIEKLKQGLQLMVAVRTATQNVQHQVKFCRCGQHKLCFSHRHCPSLRGCQSLMTSVTSRS